MNHRSARSDLSAPGEAEKPARRPKLIGYGMASVRFICGTQSIHKTLEAKLSAFLGTEDTILYSSCFDANGGLFETLLGPEDAVISDELNHASIIDGIRLCKAQRARYSSEKDERDRVRSRPPQLVCRLDAHPHPRVHIGLRPMRPVGWPG